MQRYFIQETAKNDVFTITGEPFHHMKNVMRNKVGDAIDLVDENKITYHTVVSDILEERILLKIKEIKQEEKELPVDITIASAFLKGEKSDWLIQKATELGMYEFIGFPSQTSVVKWDEKKRKKKEMRLQKIALEASQQSQRIVTPKVTLLSSFEELLEVFRNFDVVLIAYEESSKEGEKTELKKILETINPHDKLLAIFGPEGGITKAEMTEFLALGGRAASLGPRILRGETAPLYLLSAASFSLELG